MKQHFDIRHDAAARYSAFMKFTAALSNSPIEPAIRHLINIRVSQINGCAFCLDMHVKQARIAGERDLRVHHLATWRDSPLFSPRERACLAWAEALTNIAATRLSEEDHDAVRTELDQQEVAELTLIVTAINAWNRIAIASGNPPGAYDKTMGLTAAGLS